MTTQLRRSFHLLVLLFSLPLVASAQGHCDYCNPTFSSCGEPCWYCRGDQVDGSCAWDRVVDSTCGEYAGGCIPDNCTPSWQETARENRGTYGRTDWWCSYPGGCVWGCDHHRVDWVTYTDANHCNTNSNYWTTNSCVDYIDAQKGWSSHQQDCCSGFGPWGLDPTFTCNHYHSCS
jgi:hypothetical protein